MSIIQLSFCLRVSSTVETVHLLGSWDCYVGQLPLSKDRVASKSGSWKGTFRFNGSTLEPGHRYWYYYIIDGYRISHNPSEASTTELTTGRELNILDVPKSKSSSPKSSSHHGSSSSGEESHKRHPPSIDIPNGRPLSVSQIKAPKPTSPHATCHVLDLNYDDKLANHFASTGPGEYTGFGTASSLSSSSFSLSSRSNSSKPNASLPGYSTPNSDYGSCTCERYGITRKGERVRLDCGGQHCGYGDSCSSSEDDGEYVGPSTRRVVMRG